MHAERKLPSVYLLVFKTIHVSQFQAPQFHPFFNNHCSIKYHDKIVTELGPVVQSPISTNPGLTLNKTYRVNPGLALIGL